MIGSGRRLTFDIGDIVSSSVLRDAQRYTSVVCPSPEGNEDKPSEVHKIATQVAEARKRDRENEDDSSLGILREIHGCSEGSRLHRVWVRRPVCALGSAAAELGNAVTQRILPHSDLLFGRHVSVSVFVEFHPTASPIAATVVLKDRDYLISTERRRAMAERRLLSSAAEGQTVSNTLHFWRDVTMVSDAKAKDLFWKQYPPLGFTEVEEEVSYGPEVHTPIPVENSVWLQPKVKQPTSTNPSLSSTKVVAWSSGGAVCVAQRGRIHCLYRPGWEQCADRKANGVGKGTFFFRDSTISDTP